MRWSAAIWPASNPPQATAALQPVFRSRANGAVHPVTGFAFLDAGKAHILDFKLSANQGVQINAGDEHITAGGSRLSLGEVQFTAERIKHFQREEGDLALVVLFVVEESVPANAATGDTLPQLLERMRKAVDEQLWKNGGIVLAIYRRAKGAWVRKQERQAKFFDSIWLGLASTLIFPTIREKMIGSNLKALICGSAPLNLDTQLFFMMLGIPVLQVYGLTETTAICTMDDPRHVEPGRVGPAISGVEMKLGENDELIVRGPNIFPGYWNRPQETAKALRNGWFHTGDQGEVNAAGNWRMGSCHGSRHSGIESLRPFGSSVLPKGS